MPDARAQFREPDRSTAYMGGYAASCGEHPSLPKQHRWGPWIAIVMPNPKYRGRYRTCKLCALCSATETCLATTNKDPANAKRG